MHPDIERVVFTEEDIAQRVRELGAQITADFTPAVERGEQVVLVSVLRGAAIFMADLARAISLPLVMDYMVVSSYGNRITSSGDVRILKDMSESVEGKHIIFAEDVIDSGLTLAALMRLFEHRAAASVSVCALLRKDVPGQADVDVRYLGFPCPTAFVVGYGLDYAERYRNLPYIGVLKPEVYEKEI